MLKGRTTGRLLALIAASLGVAVVVGVAATVLAAGADAARPEAFGWIAAIAVAGGSALGWLLLARDDSGSVGSVPGIRQCKTCGRDMAETWRLCPNCGSRVDEGAMSALGDAADGAVR